MINIWDNYNKQWLEPIAIFFGKDNVIWMIEACIPNTDPLSDGWYKIEGKQLNNIAIIGDITLNTQLLSGDLNKTSKSREPKQ